ncbi:hypothetical protein EDB92DRAFT_1947463 [Lactarius akahatsu]|uniref:Uncharacterized protein n=1 Tax=Lactarius akahatsu TaxID=416441 RepID=A0AAD4LFC8_9AGAM|nr:hypothetical protein EDB92DRAFT_1947463 [Lactarius akahatsu]
MCAVHQSLPRSELQARPASRLDAILALVRPVDDELPLTIPKTLVAPIDTLLTLCVDELPVEDPLPQSPLADTNPSSSPVVDRVLPAAPRTCTLVIYADIVSTSPLYLRTLVERTTNEILPRTQHRRHPLPPQCRFARHPVIVPRLMDDPDHLIVPHRSVSHTSPLFPRLVDVPDHLLVPHSFVPSTSLLQLPLISLPRTTDRPLCLRAFAKRKHDYNTENKSSPCTCKRPRAQLARRSVPLPQKFDFVLHHLVPLIPPFDDSNGLSNSLLDLARLAPFATSLQLLPGLSAVTYPSHEDLVAHDNSIRIKDPSPQSFLKTLDLAPSRAFAPLPSLTVALPSSPPS